MRTTVTLDSDVELKLQALMRTRGLTFKDAINSALRAGLDMARPVDVAFAVYDMGEPTVDLTHAGRLAAALEDEEIARKLAAGRGSSSTSTCCSMPPIASPSSINRPMTG